MRRIDGLGVAFDGLAALEPLPDAPATGIVAVASGATSRTGAHAISAGAARGSCGPTTRVDISSLTCLPAQRPRSSSRSSQSGASISRADAT
jgi:hypothetical protein